jgi:23S rRNA (adenine2503-C2)-methyltransferase
MPEVSFDLLRGIPAKVNLIPFNEAEELAYKRPSDRTIAVSVDPEEGSIDAFVRRNRGNDISAACGQLKKKWGNGGLSPHFKQSES